MVHIEAIQPKIRELAEKYGLSLVVLFGSQAAGQAHKESDFDVAYLSDKKISFEEEIKINTELTEIFRSDEVQLVNAKTASPLLLKRIVQSAAVLYEQKPGFFTDLYLYALRVYEDANILFNLQTDYITHKIENYKHARQKLTQ